MKRIGRFIWKILSFPFRMVCRGIRGVARFIYRCIKKFIRGVIATPMAIIRSPVKTYKGIVKARNWLLALA